MCQKSSTFPLSYIETSFQKVFHALEERNKRARKKGAPWSVMCVFPKNTFLVAYILYEEQPKRLVLIPQATSIILVMDSPIDISHPQLKAKRIYSRLQSAEILPYQSIVRMAMSMNGAAIHRNTYHFYMYVIPKLECKIRKKNIGCAFLQNCFIFLRILNRKSN